MDVAGAARLTLAVDFDATLNSYVSGFTDAAEIPDPPVEGAIAWLYDVAAAFDLVVFTNRASSPEGIAAVINWLTEHGFVGVPYRVTDVKPVAVMYVDDRGWHFAGPGTYPTVAEILAFRPWNDAEQRHSPPPPPPTTPDELAGALAARAAFAEPWLTAAAARAVSAAGGRLVGLDDRLKSREHLAGKIEATVADDGVTPLVAAGQVNDAVRYTAVLDAGRYTVAAKKALVALTALGLTVVRVRNYWAYDGDVSGPGTSGTYVGVNVVLETRDGYPFEVQFHTPESLEAQKVCWDGYRRLRKGDLGPLDRAATVERMRAVNAAVPEPPRARKLRLSGGSVVAAAAPRAVPAATHSETLRAAADMALRLEGKLAGLIQPILARAGADAAAAFRAKATDHLTAAAPDVTPTMAMVCVMPTEAQQDALASPGGNDARTLHATLVFLGEVEGSLEPLRAALAPVAASHAPLRGKVGGCGRFDPPGVGILLPDVPGLVELRVAVTEALAAAGIDYARDHGFEAHITVGDPDAVDPGGDARAGLPLDFDDLVIVRGDVERVALPLVGPPPLTAAATRKVAETTGAVELTLLEARRELAAAEAAAHEAAAEHDAALAAGDAERLAAATKKMEDARRRVAAANRKLQDAVVPPAEPVAPDVVQKAAQAKAPTVRPDTVKNVVDLTSKTTDRLPGNVDEIRSALRDAIAQGKKGDIAKKIAADLKVPRNDVLTIGFGDGLGYELEQALGKPLDDYWKYAPRAGWSKPVVDELLPGDKVAAEVRRTTGPVVQTVVKNVAGAAVGRVGIAFDVTNPHIARVIDRAGQQVTGIVQTTKDDIRKVIDESYAKGLSIPHTAEEIQNVLTDSSFTRATLIARTELVGAVNGASLAATNVVADATGAAYQKSWMTAPGAPHPRHEDYDGLDGQTVELDQPFDVGGEALMYPGDPDGDPGEVCNCRCSMEYVDASGQAVGDAVEADTLAEGGGTDLAVPTTTSPATATPEAQPTKPRDPILGITPFRAGEDNPLGFYNSAKAQQFEADVKTTADKYGVTVTSSRHVTGLWEGETEPSYAIHATDGAGVEKMAEELRARYNQDGVLVFTPKADLLPGQEVNAVQYRISGIDPARATATLPSFGLPGGTAFGHQVEVIGSQADAEKVAAAAKQLGGTVTLRPGHSVLLERPAATETLGGALKAPDAAAQLGDLSWRGTTSSAWRVQQAQAQSILTTGLEQHAYGSVKNEFGAPYASDITGTDAASRAAKIATTQTLDARLQNDAAWRAATAEPTTATLDTLKPGDVFRGESGTPTWEVVKPYDTSTGEIRVRPTEQTPGDPSHQPLFFSPEAPPPTVTVFQGQTHPFPTADYQGTTTESSRAVAGMIDNWALTSADSNPWAIAMQRAVQDEFGLTAATSHFNSVTMKQADAIYAEKGAALRAFARAQYDETQAQLAAAGVHDLTLYRGVWNVPGAGARIEDVHLQPASSFSADYRTALDFATRGFSGDGVLTATSVPASRILSTPRSGWGSLGEQEFVVLGRPKGAPADQAVVLGTGPRTDLPPAEAQFWHAATGAKLK